MFVYLAIRASGPGALPRARVCGAHGGQGLPWRHA
jgi:hypothetical protein